MALSPLGKISFSPETVFSDCVYITDHLNQQNLYPGFSSSLHIVSDLASKAWIHRNDPARQVNSNSGFQTDRGGQCGVRIGQMSGSG